IASASTGRCRAPPAPLRLGAADRRRRRAAARRADVRDGSPGPRAAASGRRSRSHRWCRCWRRRRVDRVPRGTAEPVGGVRPGRAQVTTRSRIGLRNARVTPGDLVSPDRRVRQPRAATHHHPPHRRRCMTVTSRTRRTARLATTGAFAAVAALALAACGGGGDGGDGGETGGDGGGDASGLELVADGTLTVCSDIPYPPFEVEDSSAESGYSGFDMDVMHEIATRLDLTLSAQDVSFDALQSGAVLGAGQCDVGAPAVAISVEGAQNLAFSDPYYDSRQSLLVPADSGVTSLDNFGGSLGVQQGTTGQSYAEEHAPEGAELIEFPSDGE